MSVFQKRRIAWLWAPGAVLGLAVYFVSFLFTLTVNGLGLIGLVLVVVFGGMAVCDAEGRLL